MREIIDIDNVLKSHHTVLFAFGKGDSEYSSIIHSALSYLKEVTEDLHVVDISRDKFLREQVRKYSSWDFFPQLYVCGEFIGGAFIFPEFFASGEYNRILANRVPSVILNNKSLASESIRARNKTSAIWRFDYQPNIRKLIGASASGSIILCNSDTQSVDDIYQIHQGWVNVAKFFNNGQLSISWSYGCNYTYT